MKMKFYRCSKCGQIIAIVKETSAPVYCCGEPMEELVPGMTDGAAEKHVPTYSEDGGTVTVRIGSVDHPMLPAHYIEWIAVMTRNGNQRKTLKPGDAPEASFALMVGDEVLAVYAYCNLHGLWKA